LAKEFGAAVFLAYGKGEHLAPGVTMQNVQRALKRHGTTPTVVEYKPPTDFVDAQRVHLDVLTRLAEFLSEHSGQ
jgi:hypothetical protein